MTMGEEHLGAALRTVALNSIRAGLVARAADQRAGPSGPAPGGQPDSREPALSRYPDFAAVLAPGEDEAASMWLRRPVQIGGRSAAAISWTGSNIRVAASSLPPSEGGSRLKVHCHRNSTPAFGVRFRYWPLCRIGGLHPWG